MGCWSTNLEIQEEGKRDAPAKDFLAGILSQLGGIVLVTWSEYIFFLLLLCMYISSNDFHIGINDITIDTGGRNRSLVVFLLIQTRNNLSPLTFFSSWSSLITFCSFNHIGTAPAAKHIRRQKENKGSSGGGCSFRNQAS